MPGRPAATVRTVPTPTDPPVTVLTTVLDEVDAIGELLATLLAQVGDDDEIVVVDGGSTDGTTDRIRTVARDDARVRLLAAPGTNIPTGRNRGIAAATHAVVCCTDAGCRPHDGWLDALRAPFGRDDPPDLVTGIYRVTGDGPVARALAHAGYPHPDDAHGMSTFVDVWSRLFGRRWDAAMPTGRSVAFRRSAWERVGGFPAHLDTGEDVVFGRQVVATGGRAELAPHAVVDWAQRPTVRTTARMYRRYGVGGGQGDDPLVIGRDLARVAALATAPWFLRPGRRWFAGALGALYVSVPAWRAWRDDGPAAAALVAPAVALKDVAKAYGVLQGLASRVRRNS